MFCFSRRPSLHLSNLTCFVVQLLAASSLKSPVTQPFLHQLVLVDNKEKIKALHQWDGKPLVVGRFPFQKDCNVVCVSHIDGILPKGSYPPCLRMVDRTPFAGYPRYVMASSWVTTCLHCLLAYFNCLRPSDHREARHSMGYGNLFKTVVYR